MHRTAHRWITQAYGWLAAAGWSVLASAAEPLLHSSGPGSAGLRAEAAGFTLVGNLGEWGAQVDQGVVGLRAGFVGQLYDVVALVVAPESQEVDEGASVAFAAVGRCDDDTMLVPDSANWSLISGPLVAIDDAGLGTAGAVYEAETATVRVAALDLTALGSVRVLDVDPDNFGIFGGDDVQDLWQVGHFGVASTNGLASADPDGDGQDNRSEFVVGTDPLAADAGFRLALARAGTLRVSGSPAFGTRLYQLERTDALRTGAWQSVAGGTAALSNGQWVIAGLAETNPLALYRMRVEYPWR